MTMKKTTKIIVALIMGVVGSMMISCANPNGSDDYIPSIPSNSSPSIPSNSSNHNDDTNDKSTRKWTVKFHVNNAYDTPLEVNDGEKIPSDKIPSGYDWDFDFETSITENVIIEGTVKEGTVKLPSTPSGNNNDDDTHDIHNTLSKESIEYDLNVNNNKVYIVLSSNNGTKITSTTNASKFDELCGLIVSNVTIKNNGEKKQFLFNECEFSLGSYVELNKGENVLTDMTKSFEKNDYKFEFKTNANSIYNIINGTTIYR